MKRTLELTCLSAVAVAALACNSSSPSTQKAKDQTPATATKATPAAAAPAPATPVAKPANGALHSKSGLIKLAAVAALPGGDTVSPTPGYPGKGFHFGVIADQAAWQRFSDAAKLTSFPAIDWKSQMVVYAVLDAQTNSLDFSSWSVAANGDASFSFKWIGIEPFYPDATPAAIAVVPTSGVKRIHFVHSPDTDAGKPGKTEATITLP